MDGMSFDAQRKKETKNKVVFAEVEVSGQPTAVGSVYVEKWLIDLLEEKGKVGTIKVTIEAKR